MLSWIAHAIALWLACVVVVPVASGVNAGVAGRERVGGASGTRKCVEMDMMKVLSRGVCHGSNAAGVQVDAVNLTDSHREVLLTA